MALFLKRKDGFMKIRELNIDYEKHIQSITRNNLEKIFNLEFVKDEFKLPDGRADILAYDKNNRRFVIIEFKKKQKKGILEQLGKYLVLAKHHKDALCQAYVEKHNVVFKASMVNWNKLIGIAIAPSFDKDQIISLERHNDIVLCEVHRYENDIFEFKQLEDVSNHTKEVNSPMVVKMASSTKDLESHLNKCGKNIRQIYEELEKQIMKVISNAETVITQYYISFTLNHRTIVRIYTHKNKLRIHMLLPFKKIRIPKHSTLIIKPKPNLHSCGDSETFISNYSDIIHLMKFVKRSYESAIIVKPILSRPSTEISEHAGNTTSSSERTTVQTTLGSDRHRTSEYTEDDYLDGKYTRFNLSPEIKKLWSELKHQIFDNFEKLEFKQNKRYAGFYLAGGNHAVCTIEALKSKIYLCYSTTVNKRLLLPSDFVKDVSNVGHWGLGHYRSEITNTNDIQKAIPLIEKVYQNNS